MEKVTRLNRKRKNNRKNKPMVKINMRGLEEYRKLYEEDKAISLFLYDIIFPDISFHAVTPKGQARILMLGKAVEKIIKESKKSQKNGN